MNERDVTFFQKSCIDFAISAKPLERYMPKEMDSFKYKIWCQDYKPLLNFVNDSGVK